MLRSYGLHVYSVAEADTHLRQIRVYLFTPPAGATAYGLGQLGPGVARVWALLPSCRPPNPDDPREPCPVDRVIFEAVGGGTVHSMDPQGLAPGAEPRRVQSFSIPEGTRRVNIKVMGLQARVRYEATVDVRAASSRPRHWVVFHAKGPAGKDLAPLHPGRMPFAMSNPVYF